MLKDVRRAWLVAFVFSAFINVLMLSTPIYTLQVFETVVPLGSIETLVTITLIMSLAIASLALLEVTRDVVLLRASIWLDHELGRHVLENGLKLGLPAQEIKQDAKALEQFHTFLASSSAGVIMDAPFVPLFLVALMALNPVIGSVSMGCSAFLVFAALLQTLFTAKLQAESARTHERSEKWWRTVASNGQLAGSFGLVKGITAQWESYNRSHISAAYSLGKRTSLVKAVARSIRIGAQIAIYGVGAWLVIKNELAPGALVASAILLSRALAPLEGLVGSVKNIQVAFAAYRRLKALADDAKVAALSDRDAEVVGRVTLQDVTYYHPGRKIPALRGVTFNMLPGQSVAIVGPNGSGKSTLAGILAGALNPTAGIAALDGLPVTKWQRGDCEPPVGYLADEPLLLEGSVHDNIARFTEMSQIGVAQAAMRAGVHETLQALHAGYDTPVGPNGSNLSLRERRAVSFARAVAGKPKIIVLDEPEIGLDGASMRRLMSNLEALKDRGVALVIATQDPRLLTLVDKVVVLANGAMQAVSDAAEFGRIHQKRSAVVNEVH